MSPQDNSEFIGRILEKRRILVEKHEKHFPGKLWVLKTCLAVKAVTLISDVTLPVMVILTGPPSAGKSTEITIIGSLPDSLSLDSFTPKAFVTQMANKTEEQLRDIDLLKQIENKMFLTSDLAPLFSVRDDSLGEILGILTRVLDGQGYTSSSGAHGRRGYDKIFFVWIGAVVDVSKKVWAMISSMGPKMYFLRIDVDVSYEEEQNKIIENMKGISYEQKIREVVEPLKEYWSLLKEFSNQKAGKIVWDYAREDPSLMVKIAEHSQLLARLRGHVPTDPSSRRGGSDYEFLPPTIEDPNRATQVLYNIVRGYALCQCRNYIVEDDIKIITQIVMSSAPRERIQLLKLLRKNNGEIDTRQVMTELKVSRSTALKTMKQFEILGLVDEVKKAGITKPFVAIRLKEYFGWILK